MTGSQLYPVTFYPAMTQLDKDKNIIKLWLLKEKIEIRYRIEIINCI